MSENKSTTITLRDALLEFVVRASQKDATSEEVQALPEVARVLIELAENLIL